MSKEFLHQPQDLQYLQHNWHLPWIFGLIPPNKGLFFQNSDWDSAVTRTAKFQLSHHHWSSKTISCQSKKIHLEHFKENSQDITNLNSSHPSSDLWIIQKYPNAKKQKFPNPIKLLHLDSQEKHRNTNETIKEVNLHTIFITNFPHPHFLSNQKEKKKIVQKYLLVRCTFFIIAVRVIRGSSDSEELTALLLSLLVVIQESRRNESITRIGREHRL